MPLVVLPAKLPALLSVRLGILSLFRNRHMLGTIPRVRHAREKRLLARVTDHRQKLLCPSGCSWIWSYRPRLPRELLHNPLAVLPRIHWRTSVWREIATSTMSGMTTAHHCHCQHRTSSALRQTPTQRAHAFRRMNRFTFRLPTLEDFPRRPSSPERTPGAHCQSTSATPTQATGLPPFRWCRAQVDRLLTRHRRERLIAPKLPARVASRRSRSNALQSRCRWHGGSYLWPQEASSRFQQTGQLQRHIRSLRAVQCDAWCQSDGDMGGLLYRRKRRLRFQRDSPD